MELLSFTLEVLLLTQAVAFSPIENVPQSFYKIDIDAECYEEFSGKVFANPTWTIEPVNTGSPVNIFTQPANLVEAVVDGDSTLKFVLLENAFQGATVPAGVRIQVPYDHPFQVSVSDPTNVQILPAGTEGLKGFTNMTRIHAYNGRAGGKLTLRATLVDLQEQEYFHYTQGTGNGVVDAQIYSWAQNNMVSGDSGVLRFRGTGETRGTCTGSVDFYLQAPLGPCSPLQGGYSFTFSSSGKAFRHFGASCQCMRFTDNSTGCNTAPGVCCDTAPGDILPELLDLTSSDPTTKVCSLTTTSGASSWIVSTMVAVAFGVVTLSFALI